MSLLKMKTFNNVFQITRFDRNYLFLLGKNINEKGGNLMFKAMNKPRNKNWSALIALPLAAFMLGRMVGKMMIDRG